MNCFRRKSCNILLQRNHIRYTSTIALKRTSLHSLHVELDGKLVDFSGYEMPVQFPDGIVKSHIHTRTKDCASLFDVSHMGQLKITGKDRIRFIEKLLVGDIKELSVGESKLSLLTDEKGGIIDDCVITSYEDHLYIVINAANKEKDLNHMEKYRKIFRHDVEIERIDSLSLLALQGPGAAEIINNYINQDINNILEFMNGKDFSLTYKNENKMNINTNCLITRCGYTGEDGFEIAIPNENSISFARSLLMNHRNNLNQSRVLPAGLGARDSLRLEAGLCLHGHDIDQSMTPVEASLSWTIGKRRRYEAKHNFDDSFLGAKNIINQLENKDYSKKRVGFIVNGPPLPAREGLEIVLNDENETLVGKVTSGTYSPILRQAIGMAFVDKKFSKIGTKLLIKNRNKIQEMTISKMPFVPTKYYKK